MRAFGLCLAVVAILVAAACTGDDPPFVQPTAPSDGGASSSGNASSSSGGSSSGADVFVDPGGPFVTTFGNNGTLVLDKPANAMGVAPGGEVVWVNGTDPDSESLLHIHRLDATGKPDATGLEADLTLAHEDGNQREVATAAGFARRGPDDYVFVLGGRGDTSAPSSATRAPDVWLRAYATRDNVSTSRVNYSPASADVDSVVAVAYGPNANGSNGHVYGAWTNGAANDPSAYIVSNGNALKIDDHAIAGGIAVDPVQSDFVYAVARSVSPGNPKQVRVLRANGIAVAVDTAWNGGQPVVLVAQADVTSTNVVALDAGKIAVGGTTAAGQLTFSTITSDAAPVVVTLPPLPTLDVKPIVNAMVRRGLTDTAKVSKIVFAGCIGESATSRGWIAQVTVTGAGAVNYDPSFGVDGQYKFPGRDGECVKALGLDQNDRITVLIGGPGGDRIHKLTL